MAASSFFFFALGGGFALSIGAVVGVVGAGLAAWRWYHPLIVLTPEGFQAAVAPFRRSRGLAWAETVGWAVHGRRLGFASVTGERVVVPLSDLTRTERDRLLGAIELLQIPRDYLRVFSDPDKAYRTWRWKGRVALLTLILLYVLTWHLSSCACPLHGGTPAG